jgi:23S rRNA (adenine2503-C2)-methyltransferase
MDQMPETNSIDLLGLTCSDCAARAQARGSGSGQAREAYRKVFRDGASRVSSRGREIARAEPGEIGSVLKEEADDETTVKFLMKVAGVERGRLAESGPLEIESVVIPMIGRKGERTHTLCVSSQVGCALGCTFCETAQMGLVRSLTAAEIVGQWFAATHDEATGGPRRISNIVFMGMGEPMDNAEAVIQAIRVLCDHNGASIGASNITVSTVGRVDGLERLAELVREPGFHRLGLAVSINAPNDEIRSQIMPVNRAMPMGLLREALLAFPIRGGGKICFEYVLIPGVNDAAEHARELAGYLEPFGAKGGSRVPLGLVNLIPYNPRRDSPWRAPLEDEVQRFMEALTSAGVYVKRRRTKGRDMMGACGQLGAAQIRGRRMVPVSVDGVGGDVDSGKAGDNASVAG